LIARDSATQPQTLEVFGGGRRRKFPVEPRIDVFVGDRIPMQQRIADHFHRRMNEIAGLEVNAAGEVAEVAALDPDLAAFKPGPIDPREEGERTQFVEGAASRDRALLTARSAASQLAFLPNEKRMVPGA
jgi:hypothetical protein